MIEITTKLKSGARVDVRGQLSLPFESRQRRWLRAKLVSGEDVALRLPRGEVLRGGDLVLASDGSAIEVVAAAEKVVHVEAATPAELTRAAYHLGNRHVPLQVGEGFLRLAEDHVLEEMLRGLGVKITPMEAPFEPEIGAYSSGHHRHKDEAIAGGGKIHDSIQDHDD